MEYTSKEILLKNGKICVLRLAEASDAEMLLEYLKVTSAQTPYTAREPEEVRTSVEEEVGLIRKNGRIPALCTCWRLWTARSRGAAPLRPIRIGYGTGTGATWGYLCTGNSGAWASGPRL